ncbi:MAG: hypothetical protein KAR21_00370, partial [Spirochaetales bacterium]|nr:hypothetical protein [Spirochaetales bacterium]
MASLRSKLLIPTFMVSVLFIVAIAYIAIIQYEMFRQQTENIQWQGEKQLYVFIDEMQQQSRQFLDLLSNKWHFLDSVTMRNMDALLNEIMPFNKGLLNNFVTVYDMEGNIIAQAEDPGIFDKPDELHPHILKMKTGPVTQSIVAIYKDTLLVLELKRLENNYGAVGVLAVGNYITQEEVDEFARLRQSHLILNYNNTPVVFSKGSSLPEDMSESMIQVKFEGNFGEKSPLTAFLYKDTSKMETAYWRNLIIIVFVLAALSSMVLFFAWRIVMGTVNALDDARMSSEKELVQRKQAESALNKLNVELENLVKERTEKLENEIFEHRLAEEDLEESRRLLDETAKISKTGGWEYDIQSHKATWTDEVYLIHEVPFDYDMNVEMGIAFYKQDDQSIIEHNFKKAIEDGEPYDLELQFTTAKGK